MPKPNQTITQREREICERVRIARIEIVKWSQPMLATALGLTQNQLAGIEYARAPLRSQTGLKLCQRFDVNQRWLALGELPSQPFFKTISDISKMEPFGLTFSELFDSFLDGPTAVIADEIIRTVGEEKYRSGNWEAALLASLPDAGSSQSRALAFLVNKLIPLRLASLPEDLLGDYGAALLKADEDFRKKFGKEIPQLKPLAERSENSSPPKKASKLSPLEQLKAAFGENDLTQVSPKRKTESVTEIQRLIKDAKSKLSQPGAKSALAKQLGVAPARISEWLSGDKEPSGQYALQLYNWVYDLKPKN